MKTSVKIVRALQVESSIVSWMFIGYFVLLAATVSVVINQNSTDSQTAAGASGIQHMQMAK